MNTLLYLLEKYPDKNWNYWRLSLNYNIPLNYIKDNFNKVWDWRCISHRVTYKEFIDNPHLPWDYGTLSTNINISLDIILNNLDKVWDWKYISRRVTFEEFINNPNLQWNYKGLSNNINISLEYIKNNLYDNINVNLNKVWNWKYISQRVTFEEFINNPNLPWNYKGLSNNINISLECIKNILYDNTNVNLNKDWNWNYISYRVTYKEFINNPNLPWNYKYLSVNKNIPIEYIKNNLYDNRNVNLNKDWNWNYISYRVTYKEFINNPNLPWNYKYLSGNQNIPLDYIKNNLDKDWDWNCITATITYEEFINNPDLPWNYKGLSINRFECESHILAKNIMNIIIKDEKYIAKVYNPNRIRSVKSICELEELKSNFGWTDEEFDKYVK